MSKYKGKKILIVGFGISGAAAARYFATRGAEVAVTDLKQKAELSDSIKATADLKLEFDFGRHTSKYFLGADMIVVSPGVPLSIKPLDEAREKGIPITCEMEIAALQLKEPMVAVTGTNGKTTTVSLIGEMFRADGRSTFVGGNIGKPLIDHIATGETKDVVVAEMSSFQLGLMDKAVPAVAVFTNISQDHLDRYPDMETYIADKKRLLKLCERNSFVVLNYDDPVVSTFASDCSGKIMWFTRRNPMQIGGDFAEDFFGAYCEPGSTKLVVKVTGVEEAYDLSKLKIFGEHNRENLMAAVCAARALGVNPRAVQQVIDQFKGVEHRLEFVVKKDGVFFFNDSKATNVASMMRSIQAFKKNPLVLIAGGKDKDMDFSPLADLISKRVKILILLGEAKEKINRAVGDFSETYLVGTFEEAVLLAFQKSRSGDIILLSPGCASYDMFRNFEERGEYFKKLVSQL